MKIFFSASLVFCLLVYSVFAQPVIELIYFVPRDVQGLNERLDLKRIVDYVAAGQKFYALEMDRLGFGPKTFDFNKDVVVVQGRSASDDYQDIDDLRPEIPNRSAWHPNNIQVIFLAGHYDFQKYPGLMAQKCFATVNNPDDIRCKKYVIMPWGLGDKLNIETITAHEIGHALGLPHVTGKTNYLMHPVREVVPGVEGKVFDFELSMECAEILNTSDEVSLRPDLIDLSANIDFNTDVNSDGAVNIVDLVLVAARYGETITGNPNPNPDVDRSGKVDVNDLVLVATAIDNANSAYSAPTHPLAPVETALLPNYPNPSNPETWIPYQLSKDSEVTITIYDTKGVYVRRIPLGFQSAGFYTSGSRAAYWDGRNNVGERVASGVYFYQLQAGNVSLLRKMLILK